MAKKTLGIDKEMAIRLFKGATGELREKLIDTFGIETLAPDSGRKIVTFDDACRTCGTTEKKFNNKYSRLGLSAHTVAYEKLVIVARALNGEWVADFEKQNQKKYTPWFEFVPGVGFRCRGFDVWNASACVGSRLCYKDEATAKYAGEQFIEIYRLFLT